MGQETSLPAPRRGGPPRGARLTGKKAKFVDEYIKCSVGTDAAIAAGYSRRGARTLAWRLLHHDPHVMKAVAEARAELRERAMVSTETMLSQFDADRQFAIETKNATAAVRASELKAKLAGLLVERVDQRVAASIKVEVVRFSE
jgi:phage terminase small subunit